MNRKLSKAEQSLRDELDLYLTKNPIEKGKPGCYSGVAAKFKVDSEYVRDRYRKMIKRGITEVEVPLTNHQGNTTMKENVLTGEADFTTITSKRIKTLDDLIKACEIDINEWEIVSYEVNKWEVGRKNKSVEWKVEKGTVVNGDISDNGRIFVEPLFQVKAKLSRRKVYKDLGKQKEAVMAELKAYTRSNDRDKVIQKYSTLSRQFDSVKKDCALEINIPDLHIGKLAWGEETGDDYDIKIAVKRYKDAISTLISRTNVSQIEKFILVVGHDFLNVDGKNNLTTAGTPQSSDSRFYKMVQVGKQLLIETIDELSLIANVDVIVVPGNHDSNSMLMMGDVLDAWYHKDENIKIYNDAAPRKYYQYGNTGIMYAHGHNENIAELDRVFSTQEPQLWAATKFRRIHVGHFHHSKQLKIKDIDEKLGCIIKIISSLSSNDAWHSEKGYLSLKGAEAFLYHRDQGLLANYNYYL